MTYATIKFEDHRYKEHTIDVLIECEWDEERGTTVDVIKEGDVVYFSVYTVTRYCFSAAEGGCWDNWIAHELGIPFRYSTSALDLIIEAEREGLEDYAFGNIYHSTGGQECFVRVERVAGSEASTERAYYC